MNVYRENQNPSSSDREGFYDYAAVVNHRPTLASTFFAVTFLTCFYAIGVFYLLMRFGLLEPGAAVPVSLVAAFTIVWPRMAKDWSDPRSVTERYEDELLSRTAPRRSSARGGRT